IAFLSKIPNLGVEIFNLYIIFLPIDLLVVNAAAFAVGAKIIKLLLSKTFAISSFIAISEQAIVKEISFSKTYSTNSKTLFSLISTTVANSFVASFPGATNTSNCSDKIFAREYSLAEFPII